jgi:hypothetical protein
MSLDLGTRTQLVPNQLTLACRAWLLHHAIAEAMVDEFLRTDGSNTVSSGLCRTMIREGLGGQA